MTLKSALNDYITGLRHVGHVVEDLDAAVESFINVYGVKADSVRYVPETPDEDIPARFAFITIGDSEFELVQPVSADLREMLFARPSGSAGINHVAWQVSDLDACLAILEKRGIGPGHVTSNGPVGYKNQRFVYLDPEACDGLLIELIETTDD